MKHFILFFSILTVISITSCKKEGCTDPNAINYDSSADKEDYTCDYKPKLIIYSNRTDVGTFDVYINNVPKGTFSSSSGFIDCDNTSNAFVISLDPGFYTIDIIGSNGSEWTFTNDLKVNDCKIEQLQ